MTEPVGELITWPRRYVLLTNVYFAGRAGRSVEDLAAASGAGPGDRVIDIGCGPGRLARALARRVGPKGQVVGVDPAPQMIAYASGRANEFANCRFELGAAQSLTQSDAAFDVVTSTFAMHHIREDQRAAALAAMFRVLRPGGRLMLADARPTEGIRGAAVRAMGRASARRTQHTHTAGHDPIAEVDIRRYREALREIGFDQLEFTAARLGTGILTAIKPS
jgi:ubiquinone/menaquinone biosynthesis C-methylase UbiE